jgi:hypothetical protein
VCVFLVVFVGAGWSACSRAVVVAQGGNLFGVDRKPLSKNLVVHCFVSCFVLVEPVNSKVRNKGEEKDEDDARQGSNYGLTKVVV